MKIIKRNGEEAIFNVEKIVNAIRKANNEVFEADKLTEEQIKNIASTVTEKGKGMIRALSVEEVQDFVENEIMSLGKFALA
ncbi:MAG: anaerobic ribonucleoside-triphosphate reductase, partial [Clostridia bacterium]|nr:anaerobic ribonucleoside-triphosphate reductase [Clostridia bacterium]